MKNMPYLITIIATLLLFVSCTQNTGWASKIEVGTTTVESEQVPLGLRLESYEKKIGPFKVGDKSFTVVLNLKKIPDSTGSFSETVESFEIKDEKGVSHYKRSFKIKIREDEFSETISLWGYALECRDEYFRNESGKLKRIIKDYEPKGLILYYEELPSAPSSGILCQVFALKENRLVPLFSPLTVYGAIYDLPQGGISGTLRLFDDNTMKFGVWTGWFEVIVPVKVLNGLRTVPLHYSLTYDLSAYDVKVEREPSEEETFVRLFESPESSAIPRHVVIKKATKVEFLWTYAKIVIESDEEQGVISISEDEAPWLKVRIDGKEGFVRDAEDLRALGIQEAG